MPHYLIDSCPWQSLGEVIEVTWDSRWDLQDTRISRGDGGSVFVLVKDVSFPSDLPASTTAIVPIADIPQASSTAMTTPAPVTAPVTAPAPTTAPAPSAAPAPYLSVRICIASCLHLVPLRAEQYVCRAVSGCISWLHVAMALGVFIRRLLSATSCIR